MGLGFEGGVFGQFTGQSTRDSFGVIWILEMWSAGVGGFYGVDVMCTVYALDIVYFIVHCMVRIR